MLVFDLLAAVVQVFAVLVFDMLMVLALENVLTFLLKTFVAIVPVVAALVLVMIFELVQSVSAGLNDLRHLSSILCNPVVFLLGHQIINNHFFF